jgi:hypothetical protein
MTTDNFQLTEARPMGNGAVCYVPKSWVGIFEDILKDIVEGNKK